MIKNFKSFESIYSMAARLASGQFTKPTRGNEYYVHRVLVTFPDTTQLSFEILSENYNSDIVNYKIKSSQLGSLQSIYIDIFGDSIQMGDYQEFVFVRCWNNPSDFLVNDWDGYIFNSEKDSPFHEIDMKFGIGDYSDDSKFEGTKFSTKWFKNSYLDQNTLKRILTQYKSECPSGIDYITLKTLVRKLESYLLDQSGEIDLNHKISGISIISILYAAHLKLRPNGMSVFDTIGLTSQTIQTGKLDFVKLADLFFPE